MVGKVRVRWRVKNTGLGRAVFNSSFENKYLENKLSILIHERRHVITLYKQLVTAMLCRETVGHARGSLRYAKVLICEDWVILPDTSHIVLIPFISGLVYYRSTWFSPDKSAACCGRLGAFG